MSAAAPWGLASRASAWSQTLVVCAMALVGSACVFDVQTFDGQASGATATDDEDLDDSALTDDVDADDADPDEGVGPMTSIEAQAIVGFPYRIVIRQWSPEQGYCAILEMTSPSTVPPSGITTPSSYGVTSIFVFGTIAPCTLPEPTNEEPKLPSGATGTIAWADPALPTFDCALDVDVLLVMDAQALGVPPAISMFADDLMIMDCGED